MQDTSTAASRCPMCGLYAEANVALMSALGMLLELSMLQERALADDETLTEADVARNKALSGQFPLQVAECKRLVTRINEAEKQPAILLLNRQH